MPDSFRHKQRQRDKVFQCNTVCWKELCQRVVWLLLLLLWPQIFPPKWHLDNLGMLKSSISTSLPPPWLNRATSPDNCAVLVFLWICPVNRARFPTLHLYLFIKVKLKEPVLRVSSSEVCVSHIEVQHCQFVQWNCCQFRSSFQRVHCKLSGTNECMQSEGMGIMCHQSKEWTAVMLLDFFKGIKRKCSCCIACYCKSWKKPAKILFNAIKNDIYVTRVWKIFSFTFAFTQT